MSVLLLNSNSLQTDNIITSEIQHIDNPNKDFDMYALAHAQRSHIPGYNYTNKVIKLRGSLNAESISDMDILIDTFKGYFVGQDKELDIEHGSSTRRYLVTPNALSIKRPGGLRHAEFEANLTCALPFGIDTTETILLTDTVTTDADTFAVTIGGNAEFQFPIVTLTINSGTGMTSKYITIGNQENGQAMTITRTWTAGEVLIIDPANELVTVDDEDVYFSGAMPIFEPGARTITYNDNFTTRNISAEIKQNRYWL